MKQNVKLMMSSEEIEDRFGSPTYTVWSRSYTMNVLHSRPASSRDFIEKLEPSISNSNFSIMRGHSVLEDRIKEYAFHQTFRSSFN